jgi:hypothetical protein
MLSKAFPIGITLKTDKYTHIGKGLLFSGILFCSAVSLICILLNSDGITLAEPVQWPLTIDQVDL